MFLCYHSQMPHKPKPKPDDPAQSKRFIETAKAVEVDEDPKAFERVFKKIVPAKQPRPARS
jgi:hypothetical protein